MGLHISSDCNRDFLGPFSLWRKAPISFFMSVHPSFCLSPRISATTTGWIPAKFDVDDLNENMSKKNQYLVKIGQNYQVLYSTFYCAIATKAL
jgi:hypothetical protein